MKDVWATLPLSVDVDVEAVLVCLDDLDIILHHFRIVYSLGVSLKMAWLHETIGILPCEEAVSVAVVITLHEGSLTAEDVVLEELVQVGPDYVFGEASFM